MKIVVLGAGLIGVSTAYYLMRAGHEVVVIDRQPEAGLETSFANGGQVSASHATPWSNPATPGKLVSWLGRADAPLVFRLSADPALWNFLLRFLAACRPGTSRRNAETVASFALYSRRLLAEIRADTGIAFDAEDRGILHVYRSDKELAGAAETAERFRALGMELEILDAAACVQREPALDAQSQTLVGGIYSPGDLSGDAHKFTQGLQKYCAERGVTFLFGTTISRLAHSGDRITGVTTSNGVISADRYVLALASYSPLMLKPLGIRLPIYPAKGYSATVPVTNSNRAPMVSITDDDHKIVLSRLGNRLRIAGTAEFNGYNTDLDEARARVVLKAGDALFPGAMDLEKAELWTGLRPLTPDGVPVIGTTRFTNLVLNTGHGTLGWTLACASGRVGADLATGARPEHDISALGPGRF